jgi:phage baseplate assembly protein gpV
MTNDAVFIETARVKVNGQEFFKDIIDVRVDASMSATTMCDITLVASRTGGETPQMIPSGVAIGDEVEVEAGSRAGTFTKIFKGDIIAISLEIDASVGEYTVIRAADKSYRMWQGSVHAAYLQQSYSDIITKMLGELGIPKGTVTADLNNPTHLHQLRTTSIGEYIRTIMDRTGAFWTVVDGKFDVHSLSDEPAATTELTYTEDLFRMRAKITGMGASQASSVRGWDPKNQRVVTAESKVKGALLPSGLADRAKKLDQVGGTNQVFTRRALVDQSEATTLATAMRNRELAERLQVRIERRSGEHLDKLYPGAAVDVKGVGSDLSGKYRIATVSHICSQGQWRSVITTGTPEPHSFAELAGTEGARAVPWTATGPVVGLVSDVKDPDGQGKVKVELSVVGENVESAWARIISPAAGKSRGMHFMPDVGDEVVVMFEQGDPARPFVIGGLWSDKNPPPLAKADNGTDNGAITSWALVGASKDQITMKNGSAKKDQFIELAMRDKNIKMHLGMDKVELWSTSGVTIEVKSGEASMLIDASGNMSLKTNGKIDLKAKQDVTIEGMNVNIKSTAGAKVEAGSTLDLKGTASAKLEASGQVAVKGAIVQIN